jgi:hypothetical protein
VCKGDDARDAGHTGARKVRAVHVTVEAVHVTVKAVHVTAAMQALEGGGLAHSVSCTGCTRLLSFLLSFR